MKTSLQILQIINKVSIRIKIICLTVSILLINSCKNGNPVSSDVSSNGKIVFVRLDKTVHRTLLFRMDRNGENVKQLTFADELLDTTDFSTASPYRGSASEPRWSPDGKKIVYSESQGPDESHIVIMNEDGSGKKSLTNVGSYAIRPRWSPSGDRIF